MWLIVGDCGDPGEHGVVAGIAATVQQIGGALSLAILIAVANSLPINIALANPAPGIERVVATMCIITAIGAGLACLALTDASSKKSLQGG